MRGEHFDAKIVHFSGTLTVCITLSTGWHRRRRVPSVKIDVLKVLAKALAGAQKAGDETAKEAKEKEQAVQAEAV